MILFAKDWRKYNTAKPDFKTTNKSFIKAASIYKTIGVKNHTFMLTLLDQRLVGIDPFSPNLTSEVCKAIATECYRNPWYYFREMARVPAASGATPRRFEANRGNMALIWLFFNGITVMLIQIRQTGKSVSSDTIMNYLLCIRGRGVDIQLITKDDTLRTKNLERIKEMEALLPGYMRHRTKHDRGNTERITVKAFGNSYQGYVGNRSPKLAFNLGRGMTSPIMQFDELSSLPNNKITLEAALPAGSAARDQARADGDPNGTIYTTTVGIKSTKEGMHSFNISQSSAIWTERLVDSRNKEELERTIRGMSPSKKLRVYCEFDHRQLGYSDEWLSRTIEDSEGDGETADADFFNKWGEGSSSSPLNKDELSKIKSSARPDSFTEISPVNMYVTRWYIAESEIESIMAKDDHAMAIDSSDAGGGDDTSLLIVNMRTGAVAAAATYNESNLILLSEHFLSFIIRFPRLLTIVERKSSGPTIIDYIVLGLMAKGINPFLRMYNTIVNSAIENKNLFEMCKNASGEALKRLTEKHKKTIGFSTSGGGITSRSELYGSTMKQAAKNAGHCVYDRKTVNQICALIVKNNRVDHPEGGNDDCVITWLLGYWVISKASNLSEYGVDVSRLLSGVTKDSKETKEYKDKGIQDSILKDLSFLRSKYISEDSFVVKARIMFKIEKLRRAITDEYIESLSVSGMMESYKRIEEIDEIRNLHFNKNQDNYNNSFDSFDVGFEGFW